MVNKWSSSCSTRDSSPPPSCCHPKFPVSLWLILPILSNPLLCFFLLLSLSSDPSMVLFPAFGLSSSFWNPCHFSLLPSSRLSPPCQPQSSSRRWLCLSTSAVSYVLSPRLPCSTTLIQLKAFIGNKTFSPKKWKLTWQGKTTACLEIFLLIKTYLWLLWICESINQFNFCQLYQR